jgi:putative acetyltransferase
MIVLRVERPEDAAAVRDLLRLSFGRDAEADLVDALRAADAMVLSLVAAEVADGGWAEEGRIVGHGLFTRVTVTRDDDGEMSLLGVGPVAVLPWRQRQGIATMLVEAGLEQVRGGGYPAAVVVGSPGYYRRFGFVPGDVWGLRWEREAPEDAFMVAELSPGALGGIRGVVRFRPEFTGV